MIVLLVCLGCVVVFARGLIFCVWFVLCGFSVFVHVLSVGCLTCACVWLLSSLLVLVCVRYGVGVMLVVFFLCFVRVGVR